MMRDNRKRQWLRTVSAALAITLTLTSFPGLSVLAEEVSKAPKLSTELWTPSEDPAAYLKPGDLTPLELQSAVLKEEEIPETIDRAQLEQNGSVNRLYEQETDMTSVLYQNRDGSKTLYIFDKPVKYKDENGKIKDKKTALSSSVDKAEYQTDYQYVAKDNDIKTYFPKQLDGKKGVVTELGEHTLSMKPVVKANEKAPQPASVAPQPAAQKKAVTGGQKEAVEYPGVFGADTVLRYTPTLDGVKEDLILMKHPEQNAFSFELDVGGLEARLNGSEVEVFDPQTNETAFTFSPIYVYDSGEEEHSTTNNQYELVKLDKNGLYQVNLIVDKAFLNAESTVYPVYVDPTITMDGGNVFSQSVLYSINGSHPMSSYLELHVGDVDKAYPDYFFERGVARTLLRLSGLLYNKTFVELPESNIRSIQLGLYDCGQETSESTIGVYPFKSTWDAKTAAYSNVNWNNYDNSKGASMVVGGNPPRGTKVDGTKGAPSENYWYYFVITNIAKAWKKGQYGGLSSINNCGLIVKASDESKAARTFESPEPPAHGDYHSPRIIMNFYDVPIESVNITTGDLKLEKGASAYIQTEIYPPQAANKKLVYSSAAPSIARVDDKGKVTAVGRGTTTITVSSAANSAVKDTVKVVAGKKAIIILPGIMGSEIYANQSINIDSEHPIYSGRKLWDPSISDVFLGDAPWQVRALQCTIKGRSLFNTSIKTPTINNLNQTSYGGQDTYRRLYQALYDEYYPDYDIVLYEYDWRYDPKETAQKLNTFIEQQGYFDLIFVAHSMGGLVSSHYLNIGSEQRDNVDKHISLGTPYLGSMLPFPIFNTGNFMDGDGLWQFWVNCLGNLSMNDAAKEIVNNITGIYSLMPSAQYWRPYLTKNGKKVTTYQETTDAFNNFFLAWNEDLFNQAQQSNNELFTNGRHITDYVDSYYIVGNGEYTVQEVNISQDIFGQKQLTTTKTNAGDGTVPLWSATIGGTTPSNKTFYKYSKFMETTALHGNLASGKMPREIIGMLSKDDDTTINFIKLIIDGLTNIFTEDILYDQYGIKKSLPTNNSLNWVEGIDDEQTEYVFDKDTPVTIKDEHDQIVYTDGKIANGTQVQNTGNQISEKVNGTSSQYAIDTKQKEKVTVSHYKAGYLQ